MNIPGDDYACAERLRWALEVNIPGNDYACADRRRWALELNIPGNNYACGRERRAAAGGGRAARPSSWRRRAPTASACAGLLR